MTRAALPRPTPLERLHLDLPVSVLEAAARLASQPTPWALLDGPPGARHAPILALATGPLQDAARVEDLGPTSVVDGKLVMLVSYDEGREALGVRSRHQPRVPNVLAFPSRAWLRPIETGCRVEVAAEDAGEARELLGAAAARFTDGKAPDPPATALEQVQPSVDRYADMVREAQRWIHEGHAYQVNLALGLHGRIHGSAWPLYQRLRGLNPSPHMGYFHAPPHTVCSCSPELLLEARGRDLRTRPIAGTRPRGSTAAEDAILEAELKANLKENAEHVMLVDLARNDLGRASVGGTVHLEHYGTIERYSHVMHLVSEVRGCLSPGFGALDAFRSVFPCGTITGAPKKRVMEITDQLEPQARGWYTGALGILEDRSARWNILIRTLEVDGDRARVMAGAGIVADSDPQAEARECLAKAQALTEVLGWTP